MSPRGWEHRIQDIVDAIAEIQAFVADLDFEQFQSDAKTMRAVGADLMIIGEAASHIPDDVEESNPEIPWHLMRAMRNRLVHAYFDIDARILWDIALKDLPQLVEPLQRLRAGE
jgi:uncharacterized protein with HEPN domain